MRIFLTGLTGFVGQNLERYILEREIGSVVPIRFRDKLPNELPSGDILIHLAGKAHDLRKTANPEEYFEVNQDKTIHLFDLFLESELRDFIYFSSVKAVADSVEGILTEDVLSEPKTPYGQSKMGAEQYLISKKLPFGKRLFILRPCMIHGPGNKGNLNLLFKTVKNGIPYPLGAFDNQRSFLSIENLLYVIERLIKDCNIPSGIYNLSDDEPISTKRLIKLIATISNSKGVIWAFPQKIIYIIAKLGDIFHLPLNSERLKKLTENYIVSNDKIKHVLGVSEFPIHSEIGMRRTIESFKLENQRS